MKLAFVGVLPIHHAVVVSPDQRPKGKTNLSLQFVIIFDSFTSQPWFFALVRVPTNHSLKSSHNNKIEESIMEDGSWGHEPKRRHEPFALIQPFHYL
jgi:hypothetical protein